MKEKQLEKLARSFFSKTIIICDCPSKGGRQPHLKLMHKFTMLLKKKVIIWNEIMIHYGFLKLTVNNQKPLVDEAWSEKKGKHKLDKMLLSILDSELNE